MSVVIDPNPPSWLATIIKNMQSQEDARFAAAELAYRQAADQFIQACISAYQTGPGFILPIWNKLMPSREVFQAVDQSDPTYPISPFTSHPEFDLLLKAPIPPSNTIDYGEKGTPLSTNATTADINSGKILDLLTRIATKLGV
jgi:hypothetical protein